MWLWVGWYVLLDIFTSVRLCSLFIAKRKGSNMVQSTPLIPDCQAVASNFETLAVWLLCQLCLFPLWGFYNIFVLVLIVLDEAQSLQDRIPVRRDGEGNRARWIGFVRRRRHMVRTLVLVEIFFWPQFYLSLCVRKFAVMLVCLRDLLLWGKSKQTPFSH